jgi:deoxyribodipyrimidine photo-lyase
VSFIYQAIKQLNQLLLPYKTSVRVFHGNPVEVIEQLLSTYTINRVFANHDYEPYATQRDLMIKKVLAEKGVLFQTFKDQVIFEKNEISKLSGEPYTVYTPYSHRWLEKLKQEPGHLYNWKSENYLFNFVQTAEKKTVSLNDIGFTEIKKVFVPYQLNSNVLTTYDKTRDFPALNTTSKVSVHLRFGTVSIRQLVSQAIEINATWLGELIWREFFMQILWHFPYVVHQPFKPKYQFIQWVNNEQNFEAWCSGQTGYPLVDAGMRELNATGFMHNRVRMVTASFLVKHLLINWQWGEAYFAEKLLDFELSSNNGNWQWAAGTGCDAAPYFRIFNPLTQAEKFDNQGVYIKKWVPEYGTVSYIQPILEHTYARNRCLETYKASL